MISEASNKISGYDHKIMVEIANYVAENEPLNEYFDPVIARKNFDIVKDSWSPEQIENFEINYAWGLSSQRAAYSKTFELINKFLNENPNLDISILDKLYEEMAKLYGFNYDLNQTYLRFRDYLLESRESMKEIYDFYEGNPIRIFNYVTRNKVKNTRGIEMKIGPFAFEFYVTQAILNEIDMPENYKTSFFQRFYKFIIPDTVVHALSEYIVYKNDNEIIINSIFIPKDNTYTNLFRDFRSYLSYKRAQKSLKKLGLKPKKEKITFSSSRDHENTHALYNIILFSKLKDKPREVINEVAGILKTVNPDLVAEEDFQNLCEYIMKNSFYEHASHELLSRINAGNFISSIGILTKKNAYNFIDTESQLNTITENNFIKDILEAHLQTSDPTKARNFRKIYQMYIQNMENELESVFFNIAKILESFPEKNKELAFRLMFSDFSKWREITHDYFYSLIKK